jgi:hypothetical protein
MTKTYPQPSGELFSLLDNIIADISQEIDDRSWADPDDTKIPALIAELEELKKDRANGVQLVPNF